MENPPPTMQDVIDTFGEITVPHVSPEARDRLFEFLREEIRKVEQGISDQWFERVLEVQAAGNLHLGLQDARIGELTNEVQERANEVQERDAQLTANDTKLNLLRDELRLRTDNYLGDVYKEALKDLREEIGTDQEKKLELVLLWDR